VNGYALQKFRPVEKKTADLDPTSEQPGVWSVQGIHGEKNLRWKKKESQSVLVLRRFLLERYTVYAIVLGHNSSKQIRGIKQMLLPLRNIQYAINSFSLFL